jgi:hypothetical protein
MISVVDLWLFSLIYVQLERDAAVQALLVHPPWWNLRKKCAQGKVVRWRA